MDLRKYVVNVYKKTCTEAENWKMYSPTDFDSVGELKRVWKSDDKGTKSAFRTVYHLPKGITHKIRQKEGH